MRVRVAGAAMVLVAASLTVGAPGAAGNGTGGGDGGEVARVSAYAVRDTGLPSFNPNVRVPSNCAQPDKVDTQQVSGVGSTANNVHIDACLFTKSASRSATASDIDGPGTYEVYGVGGISACPDPDNAGPKTAALSDTDGDGLNDRCVQTGFQVKGTAGDGEFHVRVNSTEPGAQLVWFCYDSNLNGCADERYKRLVVVVWQD